MSSAATCTRQLLQCPSNWEWYDSGANYARAGIYRPIGLENLRHRNIWILDPAGSRDAQCGSATWRDWGIGAIFGFQSCSTFFSRFVPRLAISFWFMVLPVQEMAGLYASPQGHSASQDHPRTWGLRLFVLRINWCLGLVLQNLGLIILLWDEHMCMICQHVSFSVFI